MPGVSRTMDDTVEATLRVDVRLNLTPGSTSSRASTWFWRPSTAIGQGELEHPGPAVARDLSSGRAGPGLPGFGRSRDPDRIAAADPGDRWPAADAAADIEFPFRDRGCTLSQLVRLFLRQTLVMGALAVAAAAATPTSPLRYPRPGSSLRPSRANACGRSSRSRTHLQPGQPADSQRPTGHSEAMTPSSSSMNWDQEAAGPGRHRAQGAAGGGPTSLPVPFRGGTPAGQAPVECRFRSCWKARSPVLPVRRRPSR